MSAMHARPQAALAHRPAWPGPGWVVGVRTRAYRILPVYHLGLLSDRSASGGGAPNVLHSSPQRGGVRETTLEEFLARRMNRAPLVLFGYPGILEPDEVVSRARSRIGVPYDVRRYNCEHLVTDCHGLVPQSPQFDAWSARLLQVDANPWGGPRYT